MFPNGPSPAPESKFSPVTEPHDSPAAPMQKAASDFFRSRPETTTCAQPPRQAVKPIRMPFPLLRARPAILISPFPRTLPQRKTMSTFLITQRFPLPALTDTTNLGGHGSNTLTRTKQSLAKDVVGLGKTPSASDTAEEARLREAADHHPSDFFANHQAGKSLLADGRGTQALPDLERARNLRPDDYENEFALAGAYMASGNLSNARSIVAHLLNTQDRSELHNLLGAIEERSGDPVKAEQEYRLAAKQDPTERNLFDWGAELLLHHVPAAATDVFNEGVRRFPASARMLTALGVTWYARGSYPQASEILGRAADLNPTEPTPYIFLGRILMIEASVPEGTSERIQRFLKLAPQDAWANYLAAIDLWKRTHATQDRANLDHIQALLARATELDPSFALAFFQRGVVCSEVGDIPAAMAALQHAVAADPTLAEPHYRLAQLYRRAGDEVNARRELSRYAELTASDAARADRERHEIQQFVISSPRPSNFQTVKMKGAVPAAPCLEVNLRRELDEARIVHRLRDLPEVRRVNIRTRAEELRVIENVEELRPEFQVDRFREVEELHCRHIGVDEARTPQRSTARVTELTLCRIGEAARVEELVHCPTAHLSIAGLVWTVRIAGKAHTGVVRTRRKEQWEAGHDPLDDVELPSADRGVYTAVPVAAEFASSAEGKVVDHAAGEVVVLRICDSAQSSREVPGNGK